MEVTASALPVEREDAGQWLGRPAKAGRPRPNSIGDERNDDGEQQHLLEHVERQPAVDNRDQWRQEADDGEDHPNAERHAMTARHRSIVA